MILNKNRKQTETQKQRTEVSPNFKRQFEKLTKYPAYKAMRVANDMDNILVVLNEEKDEETGAGNLIGNNLTPILLQFIVMS